MKINVWNGKDFNDEYEVEIYNGSLGDLDNEYKEYYTDGESVFAYDDTINSYVRLGHI